MTFTKGQRVQLHAATDDWMRGDRYGVVLGMHGRTRDYVNRDTRMISKVRPVRVKLDSGRVKLFHPEWLFIVEG